MKRNNTIILFVVGLLLATLAACAQPSSETGAGREVNEGGTVTAEEEVETTAEPGEESKGITDVAILVIDDFTPLTVERAEEQESRQGNCAISADGQVYAASGAVYAASGAGQVDGNELKQPVSHGDLVMKKFRDLINAYPAPITPVAAGSPGSPDIRSLEAWGLPDEAGRLWLAAVATDGLDTGVISTRIRNAMTALQSNNGIGNFVLNMSFAIVPCELLGNVEEYEELINGDPELADLRQTLQDALGVSDPEPIYRLLGPQAVARNFYTQEPGQSQEQYLQPEDPLLDLILDPPALTEDNQTSNPVISIAASGNNGLGYPFVPALWAQVLSVSAGAGDAEAEVGAGAAYANAGEVVADDIVGWEKPDGSPIQLLGTSFAAPVVSWHAAFYIMRGGTANCQGKAPPLAYAGTAGPWKNLTLAGAGSVHCATFPVAIP